MKARTWGLLGAAGLIAAGSIALAASGRAPVRYAATGAGYVAHVVCSCRYVGGRDLKSCATDLEPGMEIVRYKDDPAAKRITAWVPLLAKKTAVSDGEFGCVLEN